MYYNMYDNMYDDGMYPVRYSRELPGHDRPAHVPAPSPEHGFEPIIPIYEDYPTYPMPRDRHPCPMPMPMPMPEETLPAMEMLAEEYLADLFTRLMGKKVNILIEGRQKAVECVKVIKVEDGVVIVELKCGTVCVIPLDEISAVCMPKELAKEFFDA